MKKMQNNFVILHPNLSNCCFNIFISLFMLGNNCIFKCSILLVYMHLSVYILTNMHFYLQTLYISMHVYWTDFICVH